MERATPARLAGVKALGIGGESDLDALIDAQAVFLDSLLAQQIEDIEHGTPPSNAVAGQARCRGATASGCAPRSKRYAISTS